MLVVIILVCGFTEILALPLQSQVNHARSVKLVKTPHAIYAKKVCPSISMTGRYPPDSYARVENHDTHGEAVWPDEEIFR